MTIKHQKRLSLISLILALIMLAGLYGCRGSGDGTATSTPRRSRRRQRFR